MAIVSWTCHHRRMNLAELPLLELIPALTPQHRAPYHLRDWTELIEAASENSVRAMCSVPIRHFKTETTVHGIIYLLLRHPTWRVIFLTHSAEAANKWGKRIRQLAQATEVGPTRGQDTISDWRNDQGGGVVVMSADQSRIGYDCNVLIVDDPLDELHCHDPMVRDAVDAAISMYTARCMKDGRPGPVLIVASRFDPDDPIGRRLERTAVTWSYVHNSAILDDGLPTERAFAPDVWPLEELRKVRAEFAEYDPYERVWWAQFMNDPKPVGSDLFGVPTLYSKLPDYSFRLGYGADMAFTSGMSSDFFAICAGKVFDKQLYVLDFQRVKLDATQIEATSRQFLNMYGTAPIYSYVSGPEMGTLKLMRERGIPMVPMRARYNKMVRAQRTIRRHNDGLIQWPDGAAWRKSVLARISRFRGADKDQDDEVDALVSLSDGALGGAVAGTVKTLGKSYRGFSVT